MTFIWPVMFVLLMAVPPLIAAYLHVQQRRRHLVALYGNPTLTSGTARPPSAFRTARRHVPAALFLAALVILIVALARPQATVSLPRVQGTVILAFDVSGSMAADDLQPTRLQAAKAAAVSFVQRQPSTVQIGVVSFSEGGFPTQPPTGDQAAVMAAIERLSVQRGTSVARGIDAALAAIAADKNPPLTLAEPSGTPIPTPTPVPEGTYSSAVIVLLSDGENNQAPDPLESAQTAASRGVRIYTVGIGSAEGAMLNIEGFSVRSRLDEQTLRQISDLTGGTYYNAENEDELRTIYDNLSPELVVKPEEMEVTSLFAGAGLLLLMIGGLLSLFWLGRLP
jgi:Ca-activated chloride channel family protein